MAAFVGGMPDDLIKMFTQLEKNTEQMLADMVTAGAEVVEANVNAKMPKDFAKVAKNNVKVTRVYKTPSDDVNAVKTELQKAGAELKAQTKKELKKKAAELKEDKDLKAL